MYVFQTHLQKGKDQDEVELCEKLNKLEILEKECWRLTSTQKAAEVSKYEPNFSYCKCLSFTRLPFEAVVQDLCAPLGQDISISFLLFNLNLCRCI